MPKEANIFTKPYGDKNERKMQSFSRRNSTALG